MHRTPPTTTHTANTAPPALSLSHPSRKNLSWVNGMGWMVFGAWKFTCLVTHHSISKNITPLASRTLFCSFGNRAVIVKQYSCGFQNTCKQGALSGVGRTKHPPPLWSDVRSRDSASLLGALMTNSLVKHLNQGIQIFRLNSHALLNNAIMHENGILYRTYSLKGKWVFISLKTARNVSYRQLVVLVFLQ